MTPGAGSKVQPRSASSQFTTESEIMPSSPLSRRKISVRCAHGQASDMMRWYRPGSALKPPIAARSRLPRRRDPVAERTVGPDKPPATIVREVARRPAIALSRGRPCAVLS